VVLGLPGSAVVCQGYFDILEQVCTSFGVPLAPGKTEGPSSKIIFLGTVIDTVSGELSLPQEKWTGYSLQ